MDFKILYVEDDEIASLLTCKQIKKLNCKIDVANTGVEAIKLYLKNHYDLILMDLGLPDMTGLSVSKIIRQHKNSSSIPIIALTAHGDVHNKEAALKAGMDDLFVKPVENDLLIDLINKVKIGSLK